MVLQVGLQTGITITRMVPQMDIQMVTDIRMATLNLDSGVVTPKRKPG